MAGEKRFTFGSVRCCLSLQLLRDVHALSLISGLDHVQAQGHVTVVTYCPRAGVFYKYNMPPLKFVEIRIHRGTKSFSDFCAFVLEYPH